MSLPLIVTLPLLLCTAVTVLWLAARPVSNLLMRVPPTTMGLAAVLGFLVFLGAYGYAAQDAKQWQATERQKYWRLYRWHACIVWGRTPRADWGRCEALLQPPHDRRGK